jgi:SAM-dependent methyltransferase
MSDNSWRAYFDGMAQTYMQEEYALPWREEVDFYLDVLRLDPGARLLDLGCGPGRHTVELARRGYHVIGLDFSEAMLRETEAAALRAGVSVTLLHADATNFQLSEPVDAVLCMLEAGLGFVNLDQDPNQHDRALLEHVNQALKQDGRFILGVPNTYRFLRHYDPQDSGEGVFDPITMILEHDVTWTTPEGSEATVRVRIREYLPPELRVMLERAGFVVEEMWGGTYGRNSINFDDHIITIVSRKFASVEIK